MLVFSVANDHSKVDLAHDKSVQMSLGKGKINVIGNYFVVAQWSGSQNSTSFGFKWNKKGEKDKKMNLMVLAYTLLPSFGTCIALLWLISYCRRKKEAESLRTNYKTMIKSEPIDESFIENFFPNKYYLEGKDEICPICFDLYELFSLKIGDEVNYLKCKHLYHLSCFEQWVLSKPTFYVCPVCKSDIFEFGIEKPE